ncbi:M14 family metallopeptidase [Ekhidna sp.]
MKKILSALLILVSLFSFAQVDMSYYLPEGLSYNPEIPTPKEVLGFHPGEWHVSHDQMLYYMREVAEASDRITIKEISRSYEGRPLIHLTISTPENLANIDQIKAEHKKLTDPSVSGSLNTSDMPIVIWLGYNVHGNEASSGNAALLVAYYLAAANGSSIDELLSNSIIILDPCYNPDGMHRFSTWVNMHRSHVINPDTNDREYSEVWPGGRTNHYWFDLNRDWLPLAHPESRGRIARFHEWKPNILTDHHEMGTNSTFFFQPGIPSRKFPWTPDKNVELTHKMADHHAKYLDEIGTLYYSEESFDDFYIGKGSTYPDVNGGVGILFEQASSRGHAQENDFGILTFPMGVRNQFTVSLSTLSSGIAHREEFLDYQKDFYESASDLASKDAVKAYIFGSSKDPVKNYELAKMLVQHEIDIYPLAKDINKNGHSFKSGNAYVVPMNQPQYRLAKGIFETRTTFTDSLFYDVSTWTMPLAYNLPYAALSSKDLSGIMGDKIISVNQPTAEFVGNKGAYAYAIEPYGYYGFRAANRLLSKGIVVQMLNNSHNDGNRIYPKGTIIIPVGVQENRRAYIEQTIDKITTEDAVNVYSLTTGLAKMGVDIGSRSNSTLEEPKIALLVEGGVSSYEAGEVWHLLDQRYKMKVTLLPIDRLGRNLSRYNRIIIPNAFLSSVSDSQKKNLKDWVSQGGLIIAWKNGGKWLSDAEITNVKYASRDNEQTDGFKTYEDLSAERGAQVTGGSIFEARIDLTHPLGYGIENERIPLFRNHNLVMEKSKNGYANPMVYTGSPLLSGYVSEENLDRFKNAPAVTISNVGRGKVITLADNPNFRAFWYGTNKIFMNALFFGKSISRNAAE